MSKYHKGDKFIVEIKEVIESDNGTLYRSNFKTLTFDDNGLDKLQKCETELSWDECYNEGLENGRNEVWELARKVFCPPRYNGIDGKTLSVLFETDIHNIPAKYTPQEALAKFDAYEKEQAEIKVGDIVYNDNTMEEGVVTHIDNGEVFMLYDDGSCGNAYGNLTKTGKHIDIQSVLEQIGGSDV